MTETPKRVLIVWHSRTGGAEQMARAAADGAAQEAEVDLRQAAATELDHVLTANGYMFVCPENLATMSGLMKEFFDRTYYGALERLNGRPYATLICAGSDGEGAARQIGRIALGWRLKPIAPPLIVGTRAQTPQAILAPKTISSADLDRCRELGATMAAGLAIGVF